MTIKNHWPWPLRVAFIGLVLGLSGAIAMWTYDLGRSFAGFSPGATKEQLASFKEQIDKLKAERDQFSTTANGADSQHTIERSAQKQLATQVRVLEAENMKLKEDLAFFESLLPSDTGSRGIAIRRLKTDIIDAHQLRYRVLIMQGGKGGRDFVGNLQFAVTVVRGGKSAMMIFPDGNSNEANKFKLAFKHYQRVEGILTLPDDATIKSVQARVLEKGQIRAQQSVSL